jgi:hypothetical protein
MERFFGYQAGERESSPIVLQCHSGNLPEERIASGDLFWQRKQSNEEEQDYEQD